MDINKNQTSNDDAGYRGESYKVFSAPAGETNVEATYEYTSGNYTTERAEKKENHKEGNLNETKK